MEPQRTMEEVKKEYFQKCAEAGEATFRIEDLSRQRMAALQRISELNAEGFALNQKLKDETQPQEEVADGQAAQAQ